jgi:hypothetical protein
VGEDGGADVAGPHPEGGGQLTGHFRVASQMLPEAAFVDVELSADGARVIGRTTLGYRYTITWCKWSITLTHIYVIKQTNSVTLSLSLFLCV